MDSILYSKIKKITDALAPISYYPKLKNEVVFEMKRGPEYTVEDAGDYETSNEYVANKILNDNTGIIEDTSYEIYTCETYFEIPDFCKIFYYCVNQAVTSVLAKFHFYDDSKTYMGKGTIFTVNSENVHDDNRGSELGKYISIPSNAKYFRLSKGVEHIHALILTSDEINEVDKVHIPKIYGVVGDNDVFYNTLHSTVSFEKVPDGYEIKQDAGNTLTANIYNDHHKIDVNTGEYVEVTSSSWKACETYFEIPSSSRIFHYHENQLMTAVAFIYCFYDESKFYLGSSTYFQIDSSNIHDDTWNGYLGKYVSVPSAAKYFRLWTTVGGNWHSIVFDTAYKTIVYIDNLQVEKPFVGKKILVFGDSIWGNDRTNGVCDFLQDYSGATVYNGAVGGSRITGDRNQYSSPAYKPFDGVNLIHSLLTNSWTEQDANVDSVVSYVKTDTLPMLKQLDLNEIDIIILSYGHNDFTAPKTIAEIQNAYDTAISEILTSYPEKRILIVTPPWRMFSSGTIDGDVYENENNNTLREIADGIVSGAKAKHIASINMMDELPWRAETKGYYLDSDEVHPNIEGNKIYAHVVFGKLRSMY